MKQTVVFENFENRISFLINKWQEIPPAEVLSIVSKLKNDSSIDIEKELLKIKKTPPSK